LKVFKLSGFLDAAQEDMGRREWDRAKRYLDWAVHCRPDATKVHEELGDYYLAMNDRQQAQHSYADAIRRDPKNESAKKKFTRLVGNTQEIAPLAEAILRFRTASIWQTPGWSET
jgi:cytochrome c-type biogenesis protein CcmH/NrfG